MENVLDAAIWVGYAWADEPRNHAVVMVTGRIINAFRERAGGGSKMEVLMNTPEQRRKSLRSCSIRSFPKLKQWKMSLMQPYGLAMHGPMSQEIMP
jgi:hypothetical protein